MIKIKYLRINITVTSIHMSHFNLRSENNVITSSIIVSNRLSSGIFAEILNENVTF